MLRTDFSVTIRHFALDTFITILHNEHQMMEYAQQLTGNEVLVYRSLLARELLLAGQSEEAISEIRQIMREIGKKYLNLLSKFSLFDLK